MCDVQTLFSNYSMDVHYYSLYRFLALRGVMAILVNAKNTQTTALRVRTGLTEHTCKGLGPVEAPTPRYTHDCARIFPFLAMLATSSAPVH